MYKQTAYFVIILAAESDELDFFNPLQPGVAFLYLLKTSENLGFLIFSEGIEEQHRVVMG